jgi:ribonuclease R
MTEDNLRDRTLAVVMNAGEFGISLQELLFALGEVSRSDVKRYLQVWTRKGRIAATGDDLWAAVPMTTAEGTVVFDGRKFRVASPAARGQWIELPAELLGPAMAGDLVRATCLASPTVSRPVAESVELVAPGPATLEVQAFRFHGLWVGRVVTTNEPVVLQSPPSSIREGFRYKVTRAERHPFGSGGGLMPSHVMHLAFAETAPPPTRMDRDTVLRFMVQDAGATELLERLVDGLGVPRTFPAACETESRSFEEPDAAPHGYDDLTGIPFVTIDGDDAKDFDDAVYAERRGPVVDLWVAIADVSSYVAPGSALDAEAMKRGCSVYIPGRVYPMLPHALSDQICSLQPGRKRLVAWARMRVTSAGKVSAVELGFGLITSRARLTYRQVQDFFDGAGPELAEEIARSLKCLEWVRDRRSTFRRARGLLELDLAEPAIRLSPDGVSVDSVEPAPRLRSHQLIEECMLVANESVATWLADRGWPLIYRVHDAPDEEKLRQIRVVLRRLVPGSSLSAIPTMDELDELLRGVDSDELRRVMSYAVLRSMKRAEYSTDDAGHFGLGTDRYLHFTSPIRRYPDLEVHRVLRRCLSHEQLTPVSLDHLTKRLQKSASLSNRGEGFATECERWADRILRVLYARRHLGEVFEATISDVGRFGVFVTVTSPYLEGLVPMRALVDDFYELDERTRALVGARSGHRFQLGDSLTVQLAAANLTTANIDFVVPELERDQRTRGDSSGRRGRPQRRPDDRDRGRKPRPGWPPPTSWEDERAKAPTSPRKGPLEPPRESPPEPPARAGKRRPPVESPRAGGGGWDDAAAGRPPRRKARRSGR